VDSEGRITEILKKPRNLSDRLIEQFMVITNEVIARHCCKLNLPFVYRVHEDPTPERIQSFKAFIASFGLNLYAGNEGYEPKVFQKLLNQIKETVFSQPISKIMLRSMQKARYYPENLGHFGLALKDYCHFTSPIRRYPDLFIHRVISRYIENGYALDEKEYLKLKNKATKLSITCSDCEKTATEVERDFDDLFMAKYMAKHLGDEYDGVISSITAFGMYVKLDNTVEGLVTLASLEDDYYIYNEKTMMLIGERTAKKYEIGQKIRIKVVRSSVELRQIDFITVEE